MKTFSTCPDYFPLPRLVSFPHYRRCSQDVKAWWWTHHKAVLKLSILVLEISPFLVYSYLCHYNSMGHGLKSWAVCHIYFVGNGSYSWVIWSQVCRIPAWRRRLGTIDWWFYGSPEPLTAYTPAVFDPVSSGRRLLWSSCFHLIVCSLGLTCFYTACFFPVLSRHRCHLLATFAGLWILFLLKCFLPAKRAFVICLLSSCLAVPTPAFWSRYSWKGVFTMCIVAA